MLCSPGLGKGEAPGQPKKAHPILSGTAPLEQLRRSPPRHPPPASGLASLSGLRNPEVSSARCPGEHVQPWEGMGSHPHVLAAKKLQQDPLLQPCKVNQTRTPSHDY